MRRPLTRVRKQRVHADGSLMLPGARQGLLVAQLSLGGMRHTGIRRWRQQYDPRHQLPLNSPLHEAEPYGV